MTILTEALSHLGFFNGRDCGLPPGSGSCSPFDSACPLVAAALAFSRGRIPTSGKPSSMQSALDAYHMVMMVLTAFVAGILPRPLRSTFFVLPVIWRREGPQRGGTPSVAPADVSRSSPPRFLDRAEAVEYYIPPPCPFFQEKALFAQAANLGPCAPIPTSSAFLSSSFLTRRRRSSRLFLLFVAEARSNCAPRRAAHDRPPQFLAALWVPGRRHNERGVASPPAAIADRLWRRFFSIPAWTPRPCLKFFC